MDSNKALWYEVLTYLKWDKEDMALETLDELLKDPSNYKYKEAQSILNKLKKIGQ